MTTLMPSAVGCLQSDCIADCDNTATLHLSRPCAWRSLYEWKLGLRSRRRLRFARFVYAQSRLRPVHGLQRLRTAMRYYGRRLTQHNTPGIARSNVARHYDLSDALYALFLDKGRQYSCAYYRDSTDGLEQAQEQKLRHLPPSLVATGTTHPRYRLGVGRSRDLSRADRGCGRHRPHIIRRATALCPAMGCGSWTCRPCAL